MSVGAALAVVARPWLWAAALALVWRSAVPGWWRRWPPLPLPAPEYLRLRTETFAGSGSSRLGAEAVVGYLEWCRRMGRLSR